MNKPYSQKTLLLNALFLLVCGGIFLFLWNAPPETTAKMPYDKNHAGFYSMDKKEAEKQCENCHNPKGAVPLSKEHPSKNRCLFCHKKEEQKDK